MSWWRWARKRPRVFLGQLVVVPRTGWKKAFDEWSVVGAKDLDAMLAAALEDIFALPGKDTVRDPVDTDLVLDVFVRDYQVGDAVSLEIGVFGLPVLWRPAVELQSRLSGLKTGATKATFSAKATIGWAAYLRRLFTWRGLIRVTPLFDEEEIRALLYQAAQTLLAQMVRRL